MTDAAPRKRLEALRQAQERGDKDAIRAVLADGARAAQANTALTAHRAFSAAYAQLEDSASPDEIAEAEADTLLRLRAGERAALLSGHEPGGPLEGETWGMGEEPPEREWLVGNVLPAGRLSSIYGLGEVGKSSLMLQLAAAVMAGTAPLRTDPDMSRDAQNSLIADHTLLQPVHKSGRVLWLSYEDEADEMRRRWRMAHHAGAIVAPFSDPDKITWINMRKLASPLWGPEQGMHSATISTWTPAGQRFLASLAEHRLAIIDPLAAAYSGSEIDRSLSRAFSGALDFAAEQSGCAIVLVAHPSLAGSAKDGSGYSGSTDWQAAPRGMLHLETGETGFNLDAGDDKSRKAIAPYLRHGKANYGESGRRLWLRRHFVKADPEAARPAQLAWFATHAREAANAHEQRSARIGGRKARMIVERSPKLTANGRSVKQPAGGGGNTADEWAKADLPV